MIQFKFIISGWKEVSKEKAKELVKYKLAGITTMKTKQERIDYINKNCLKGITVEELLGE